MTPRPEPQGGDPTDTLSVGTIAERVEEEFGRLRALRPALAARIGRAEDIVTAHLSCRRQRVIRVRISGTDGLGGIVRRPAQSP